MNCIDSVDEVGVTAEIYKFEWGILFNFLVDLPWENAEKWVGKFDGNCKAGLIFHT